MPGVPNHKWLSLVRSIYHLLQEEEHACVIGLESGDYDERAVARNLFKDDQSPNLHLAVLNHLLLDRLLYGLQDRADVKVRQNALFPDAGAPSEQASVAAWNAYENWTDTWNDFCAKWTSTKTDKPEDAPVEEADDFDNPGQRRLVAKSLLIQESRMEKRDEVNKAVSNLCSAALGCLGVSLVRLKL